MNELVFNQPLETGTIRAEFFGDTEKAKSYLTAGRRVLGAVRTFYGVNQRMAEGEAGGFYRHLSQLEDGTQIEVLTNNGMDTVRIYAVPETTASEIPEKDIEKPIPEEAPEEPKPRGNYKPYLWIGARIVNGPTNADGTFKNSLHVCVWEIKKGADPVILSNRNDYAGYGDAAQYPLGAWTQFHPADDYNGLAYTDDKLFMFKKNNTQGLPMYAPEETETAWDIIFISDPDNDLKIETANGAMEGADGGEHLVKVMVVGDDCGPDRTGTVEVELRVITGKDADQQDDKTNFSITEFTRYSMGILPKGWFPTQSPPAPNASCGYTPHGTPDFGANPHAPHWWQGMAAVNVASSQIEVLETDLYGSTTEFSDDGLPPTGFEPAGWPSEVDMCPAYRPCHWIFVRTFILGEYSQYNTTPDSNSVIQSLGCLYTATWLYMYLAVRRYSFAPTTAPKTRFLGDILGYAGTDLAAWGITAAAVEASIPNQIEPYADAYPLVGGGGTIPRNATKVPQAITLTEKPTFGTTSKPHFNIDARGGTACDAIGGQIWLFPVKDQAINGDIFWSREVNTIYADTRGFSIAGGDGVPPGMEADSRTSEVALREESGYAVGLVQNEIYVTLKYDSRTGQVTDITSQHSFTNELAAATAAGQKYVWNGYLYNR